MSGHKKAGASIGYSTPAWYNRCETYYRQARHKINRKVPCRFGFPLVDRVRLMPLDVLETTAAADVGGVCSAGGLEVDQGDVKKKDLRLVRGCR